MSATSCICCDVYKTWKYFHLAVNLCLIATFLLPLLMHVKPSEKQPTKYALFDSDTEQSYKITKATYDTIKRMNEIKTELYKGEE